MLSMLVFFLLLSLYLFLGLNFYRTKSIKAFMVFTVVLPLISALTIIHTKYQINVYYAFVFFPLCFFVINSLIAFKCSKYIIYSSGIVLGFISFYLCYTFLFNFDSLAVINVAKDLKPLIFLVLGFVFLNVLENYQLDWNSKLARDILKYHFVASVIWFLILNNTNLLSVFSNDVYYETNETRYASIGLSYVLFYYIASLSANKKFNVWDLIYILIPLFLAGNRTIFFALGILYVFNMLLSTNAIGFLKKIVPFVLGIFFLIVGVFKFNDKLKERILSMFDYDLVVEQLFSKRFSPFTEKLATFEWYHYIFGKGIGETLYIPWFVYRKNIDNFNISMDNIYLTLYVKYGVFSIIVYLLLVVFIFKTKTNKKFKILLAVFFFVSGLTMAFMYQTKFLFMLLVLAGFGFTNLEGKKV